MSVFQLKSQQTDILRLLTLLQITTLQRRQNSNTKMCSPYQLVFAKNTKSLIRFASPTVCKQQSIERTTFGIHACFSHLLKDVLHQLGVSFFCMKVHQLYPNLIITKQKIIITKGGLQFTQRQHFDEDPAMKIMKEFKMFIKP